MKTKHRSHEPGPMERTAECAFGLVLPCAQAESNVLIFCFESVLNKYIIKKKTGEGHYEDQL